MEAEVQFLIKKLGLTYLDAMKVPYSRRTRLVNNQIERDKREQNLSRAKSTLR